MFRRYSFIFHAVPLNLLLPFKVRYKNNLYSRLQIVYFFPLWFAKYLIIISTQQRFTEESSRWRLLRTESGKECRVYALLMIFFMKSCSVSYCPPRLSIKRLWNLYSRPQIVSVIRNISETTNSATKCHCRKTINVLYS